MIRPARPTDLEAIARIDAAGRPTPRPTTLFAQALPHLWVLEEAGAVVAFAELTEVAGEAELIDIAVDPAQRRAGRGRALLRALLEGASSVEWILLEVRAGNTAARNLYESEGFEVCGRRRRYYDDGEDAVLYRRRGGPAAPVSPERGR